MTRKDKKNTTCDCCGLSLSTSQKLRQHYIKIEYLDVLGLFDPPEIAEPIPSPKTEREYLEALGILEPILQFHQTDIISSRCKLLDDHYQ
ncbi:4278_t:CDS:2, partial [Diversispora eburnea]